MVTRVIRLSSKVIFNTIQFPELSTEVLCKVYWKVLFNIAASPLDFPVKELNIHLYPNWDWTYGSNSEVHCVS